MTLPDGTATAFGPAASGRLTVLSWNLWWRFGPWEERLPRIVAAVRALDPDVLCLQEVWIADGTCSAEVIAAELGYSWREGHRLSWDELGFGNAIVSRWPITGSAVLDLPAPPEGEEERTCLRADIDSPFGALQVFTTHLNWRFDHSAIRQEQVRAICSFVAASGADAGGRTYPPILCGDMNATPDSDEIRMLTGRAAVPSPKLVFHDAWEVARAGDPEPGFTWSNRNSFAALDLEPDRRIDYVLVGWPKDGGRGHVVDCQVVGTEPIDGMEPSDHYGVLATLRA